jgi:peptidoglycan hydrolase-like protein with peptidoglycan-binding domain
MKRSGNQREPSPFASLIGGAAAASGAAIAENPVLVGSSTAFLVVLFYVSANALWNQPYRHPGPLMETRFVVERPAAMPAPLPVARPEPVMQPPSAEVTNSVPPVQEPAAAVPATPSPVQERTMRVQIALEGLGLYRGTVDGLMGPQTRAAIAGYQKTLGMNGTGEIDDTLLDALGIGTGDRRTTRAVPEAQGSAPAPAASVPEQAYAAVPVAAPLPRPRDAAAATEMLQEVRAAAAVQTDVVRVQAGLRAFGNEGIEIDGVMGEKTRAAIREFQSLFRLPVTGEPDDRLLAKMQEIGLTN